jgi:hypothetical protein
LEIVQANPDKPWSNSFLILNPNITWDIIKANPDINWDYTFISLNSNITWDIVKANPDKPWNYQWLSRNSQKLSKEKRTNELLRFSLISKIFNIVIN